MSAVETRGNLAKTHSDVLTAKALEALGLLARLDHDRKALMQTRLRTRLERFEQRRPLGFLEPDRLVPRTSYRVGEVRAGAFSGGSIPADLERQWVQGTGPAARPRAAVETNLRNVAYALLSGADGWMFDGEDALGQTDAMSLENQRSLKLAIARDPKFLNTAESVAEDMNRWAQSFFGRRIVEDWVEQLSLTTKIFRPRGLHLDDRQVRVAGSDGLSASIVDTVLYVVGNYRKLRQQEASIVLYLPKIQTADEAAFWNLLLSELEAHLDLEDSEIRTYVLVEQLEAAFQLLEIRAALGPRFVGFNTGRWDYINSVADAMAWDPTFINPNIDAITMTYGYMAAYEDRVRRAVNTPDQHGHCALWQGGMEPNIPVGSPAGVSAGMARAVAGARRELEAGASGKWVAHWKMVHIVRPIWEEAGAANQMGRSFPPLTHTEEDARALVRLEPAPRSIRGARDLASVALQYGNAFLRGFQAAALKPADFFGDDDVLYLMEDMATGEIRLSILWEWLHKRALLTPEQNPSEDGRSVEFTTERFLSLLAEEYEKLLQAADRDVHDDSKSTTLPIARAIVESYVTESAKAPWYVDLLNLNLGVEDGAIAERRIADYLEVLRKQGGRITENLDFVARQPTDQRQEEK